MYFKLGLRYLKDCLMEVRQNRCGANIFNSEFGFIEDFEIEEIRMILDKSLYLGMRKMTTLGFFRPEPN